MAPPACQELLGPEDRTGPALLLPARPGLTASHHRRQERGDGDASERSACLQERPFPYLRWRRTLRGDLDWSRMHSRSRWRRVAAEGRPQSSTSQTARAPPSAETGVSPPVPGPGEVTSMRRQDHGSEASPTFLWIAWREGETDHIECLCRAHRAYVFERHPGSAHGLNRRGERCAMCVRSQPARTGGLPVTGARPTPSGEPGATAPRGHGPRGSRRRVSPIRHSGPPAPGLRQG